MAIPRLTNDLSFIAKLGNDPRTDNGMTTQAFKSEFDRAALIIQKYLNEVVAGAIDAVNSGAVSVGRVRPETCPVLWFDTSGSGGVIGTELEARVVYIDAHGSELVLNPATTAPRLRFRNVTILRTAFQPDDTHKNYPYRASVALEGVLASMFPEVAYSQEDIDEGNLSSAPDTYDGGVYLWAAYVPERDITIPTMNFWR